MYVITVDFKLSNQVVIKVWTLTQDVFQKNCSNCLGNTAIFTQSPISLAQSN